VERSGITNQRTSLYGMLPLPFLPRMSSLAWMWVETDNQGYDQTLLAGVQAIPSWNSFVYLKGYMLIPGTLEPLPVTCSVSSLHRCSCPPSSALSLVIGYVQDSDVESQSWSDRYSSSQEEHGMACRRASPISLLVRH